MFLLIFGPHLDDLFFHTHVATSLFYPLTLGGFFLYFDITVSGALRGLGRTSIPMRNDLIASGVELALIWMFTTHLSTAPVGVASAIAVGFVISPILNTWSLTRLTRISIPWIRILSTPLLSAVPAVLSLLLWHLWAMALHLNPLLNLSVAISIGLLAYLAALAMTGRSFGIGL